ncbi:TlpA disulfide reductase family protein [Chryseobacterium ginsenosidimutans]|uniref:TlpA family protein disulfide reductase n=1 Tax=Chryseobacterium ginsenosidimutans TaxID=687846 RepID=UPI0031E40FCD
MDMDIKRIGKNILFFPFILFTFINCQKNDSFSKNEIKSQKIDTLNVITNVSFFDTGTFALNSLINQRNFNFSISGTRKNAKESKKITLTKPTIFESYALVNGKAKVQRYFVFSKNDTLKFEFHKDGSVYKGNKNNAILNTLIADNIVYSIEEPDNSVNYIELLKKKYEDNLRIIKQNSIHYTDFQYTAINDYLKLYFYYKLFNVDFSKIRDPKVIEELDSYYNIVNNNIQILDKLNAVQNKGLIFNLLRYISFKKRNPKIIDNLQFLDKKLYKTEALDGFLLDYIEYDYTLSQNEIINIKKYIKKNPLNAEIINKRQNLSKDILDSNIEDVTSTKIIFKNILSIKAEKLIIIDLWATWCVPCLSEMPEWKKAQQKYTGKIKFIRISIDQDQKKWHTFLAKQKDTDINYIISNPNHPFIGYFKVNSIPRFILLNKNYEVISDDFLRPSNPNFNQEIEEYIK